jgi:putative peptide zinc metalloprotease protein
MRPDLITRQQRADARSAWTVKDPVSLRYYIFTPQEFAILRWLDGARSAEEIRREYERTFSPQRIPALKLQSYVASLLENGLVLAEGADQGQLLLENSMRRERQERWQAWMNWLAIRFSGLDPDRFLAWVHPKLAWIFSPWFLACSVLSMIAALMLIIANAADLRHQLPTLHEIASPTNLMWLALTFVVAKIIHEFAHALTCKHFGGECHEMGILLLLFAPCLYCNVTDSWMLQSRWQRIAVSAAGIVVELQLAAAAAFLWFFSQPGMVHTTALNMLIVCSVGTVFFNGNPLLRYDGYFVLADLVDIPNLWQESRSALHARLAQWFLASDVTVLTPSSERKAFLLSYAIASIAYRVFVAVAIILLLHRVLVPYGLGFLVPILAVSMVAAAATGAGRSLLRFWKNPAASRRLNRGRILAAMLTATAVVLGFFFLPLPCHIAAPALVSPVDAQRVYVSSPGTLVNAAAAGTQVRAGDTVAQLEDAKLRQEVVRLAGARQVAQTRVRNLETRLVDDFEAAAQYEVAKEMLADVSQQLSQRQRDEQALTLKAAVDGTVIEPPERRETAIDKQNLPTWTGSPLDSKNAHCHLDRGTLFCLVGNPNRQEAIAFVDENDVQYVRVGQAVRLIFPVAPSVVLNGRVQEIAHRNIETVPGELTVEQELATRPDAAGMRRPVHTTYSVRVTLDEHNERLLIGARGRAKIAVDGQPLFQRFLRVLRRTFAANMY